MGWRWLFILTESFWPFGGKFAFRACLVDMESMSEQEMGITILFHFDE